VAAVTGVVDCAAVSHMGPTTFCGGNGVEGGQRWPSKRSPFEATLLENGVSREQERRGVDCGRLSKRIHMVVHSVVKRRESSFADVAGCLY